MTNTNLLQTSNKHDYLIKRIGFFVCASLCLSLFTFTELVHAQGVTAGTNIKNTAIVTYNTGSVTQEPIESSPNGNSESGLGKGLATQFLVDRKIDLIVTGNTNANVTPGDSQVEVTFSLQNQGNAIQEISLTSDSNLTSDSFDVDSCNVEVTGVTGSPVTGVVLPTTGNIKLSPDQLATVSVRCNVPFSNAGSPINSGDIASVGLLATVEKNEDGSVIAESTSEMADKIETVFADDAGTADVLRDASHSAIRNYITTSSSAIPEFTMNKTILSVIDANGTDKYVTGSEVTYKIDISTTGIGTIENVIITDPTPAEMSYKLNSVHLNGTNQTDISDVTDNTDFGISTADTATIKLGNFAAGNQYEILLTYIIN